MTVGALRVDGLRHRFFFGARARVFFDLAGFL
jgi:hypothetical protein